MELVSSQPKEQSSKSCLETLLRRILQPCKCLQDLRSVKKMPETVRVGRLLRMGEKREVREGGRKEVL